MRSPATGREFGVNMEGNVPLTSTDLVPGQEIKSCIGLVAGCAVVGESHTKKFHGGIRDISMGRPRVYAKERNAHAMKR